ncbi:MAG: hypothetical protein GY845_29580 [Planctomycetes bacterium]|nr:hypothetical protein [Planctomycetota bacterium]
MVIKLAERIEEELKKGHEALHICMHEGEIDVRPRNHAKGKCRILMNITKHSARNGMTGREWDRLEDKLAKENENQNE